MPSGAGPGGLVLFSTVGRNEPTSEAGELLAGDKPFVDATGCANDARLVLTIRMKSHLHKSPENSSGVTVAKQVSVL